MKSPLTENRVFKLIVIGLITLASIALPVGYINGWFSRGKFVPHWFCESYAPGQPEGECKPGDQGYAGDAIARGASISP